jgi:hypothetical protein
VILVSHKVECSSLGLGVELSCVLLVCESVKGEGPSGKKHFVMLVLFFMK